ncbi:porin [uncultured Enterovirga sp.]|uniref:porin n=1 Tax=uncultured Enterovirga sp. TaxID=2026352 RepID=UPI0035CC56CE
MLRSALILAVLAATPAFAAERVRAEPARACPGRGPGFVEVPGTSTCIRISGRARSDYVATSRRVGRDDVPGFRSSGRVAVDTRTDTAYGPVRSYVRLRAGQDTRP